jgi:hypothetical protein
VARDADQVQLLARGVAFGRHLIGERCGDALARDRVHDQASE